MKSMQTDYGQVVQYGNNHDRSFKEVRRSNLFWFRIWGDWKILTWYFNHKFLKFLTTINSVNLNRIHSVKSLEMLEQGVEVYFQCRHWVHQLEVLQYLRVQDAHRADFDSVKLDFDSPWLEVSRIFSLMWKRIMLLVHLGTHFSHD